MIQNIFKSFASLRHSAIWGIMLSSIFATLLIMSGFIWLVYYVMDVFSFVDITWLESVIEGSGVVAAMFLSWLLFPIIVPSIASLFEDKVAGTIEEKEYSNSGKPHSYPWIKEMGFLAQGFLYNAILLPVYVIPVLNVIAYYLLNSWLLGKSIFMLVATRKHTEEGAKELWGRNSFSIKLYGAFFVFMSNIPVMNLIAPLFAIIMMVHYSRALTR